MLTRASVKRFATGTLNIAHNVARQRFEGMPNAAPGDEEDDDKNSILMYEQCGKTITFTHTVVPPLFQGKGVGGKLAKYAFDHARENDFDVVCQCTFLAKFIEQNKEKYKDLNIKIDLHKD